jgi:hypothetical protein
MAIWSKTCFAPEWAWSGRPRVLLESPDAWAVAHDLEAAGYEVVACRGPGPRERCPLLRDGHCATASAAHVIVSDLPWIEGGQIERRLRERYPSATVLADPLPQSSTLIACIGQALTATSTPVRSGSSGDAS